MKMRYVGKIIVLILALMMSFLGNAQNSKLNIDSINCYLLSEEMASYGQELKISEVKSFAMADGTVFHFDSNNAACLDSFSMIDFSKNKNDISTNRKTIITKMLIEVYLSNGMVNTIEVDCLFFCRVNHSEEIYSRNFKLNQWIKLNLGINPYAYWCNR